MFLDFGDDLPAHHQTFPPSLLLPCISILRVLLCPSLIFLFTSIPCYSPTTLPLPSGPGQTTLSFLPPTLHHTMFSPFLSSFTSTSFLLSHLTSVASLSIVSCFAVMMPPV